MPVRLYLAAGFQVPLPLLRAPPGQPQAKAGSALTDCDCQTCAALESRPWVGMVLRRGEGWERVS